MFYYEVLVVQEYVGRESVFTYSSEFEIAPFQLVLVPLQHKQAAGIIVRKTSEPAFKTKEIARVSIYALGELQRALVRFIADYYAASEAQALQLFVPAFLDKLTGLDATTSKSAPVGAHVSESPKTVPPLPDLTSEQAEAMRLLRSHPAETTVLHGETGTGKTRLYIERTSDVLTAHKSVLILAPEIALIPQLAKQIKAQFGEQVVTYHSQMTATKRAQVWQRVARGERTVVIGTRSALFLPFTSLGLLVIDEAHEPAYKQEEGVRYHATRIASVLAHAARAQLIIGSATPLVGDMYLAKAKQKTIIRLHTSAITSDKTSQTLLVDMKDRAEFSRNPLLSLTLLKEIDAALQRGEQSMVYLNRRGTARLILCSTCGWQAMCPRCDITLTYHHDTHELRCHTCGHRESVPQQCPSCKATDIIFKSAGTKALADWLQKHFPTAKIGRFDTDNLLHESLHERHEEVAGGDIDILVGTQMLVKGLDLPHLSVVGIVAADLSLQIPDFSAEERTYQLLRQAIGRVGRGHTNGTTVIQTFNPENNIILQAIAKNYDDFYTTQIEQRKTFQFSPVLSIATFWCSRKSAASAHEAAEKVLAHLKKNTQMCTILGPVITFHPRRRGYQSAQLVVKSASRAEIVRLTTLLPTGWQYDLEPINLL